MRLPVEYLRITGRHAQTHAVASGLEAAGLMTEQDPLALPSPDVCQCGGQSKVIDVRAQDGHLRSGWLWRRRECLACGARWNTWESILHPRRLRRFLEDRHIDPNIIMTAVTVQKVEGQ